MPARQNIILGDRIPRIISICVCVVTIFPLLTTDYLQRHYVIGCGVSGSPFLIQHIGKVRNVECHLEFAATVFQHEDIHDVSLHSCRLRSIRQTSDGLLLS